MSVFNSNFRPLPFASAYRPSYGVAPFYARPLQATQPSIGVPSRAGLSSIGTPFGSKGSAAAAGPRAVEFRGESKALDWKHSRGGVFPSVEGTSLALQGSARSRLGDEARLEARGASFDFGDSGLQASLISAKGTLSAPVFGGRVSTSAEAGLDASAHLWTGQDGKYGAEFMGIGAWAQRDPSGSRCVGLGTPVVEASACGSNGFFSSIAGLFKSLW